MARTAQRKVVLAGAGHAHLYVARHAAEFARAGVQLVLVDPGQFWYSGLATGMLGGQYSREEDCIDPGQVLGPEGHHLQDTIVGFDAENQIVRLESGEPLHYEVLSLNLGSEVDTEGIEGAERARPVKPIAHLFHLRQRLEQRFEAGDPPRILVVGGGPTGCEIAANLRGLARRCGAEPAIALVVRGDGIMKNASDGARKSMAKALEERKIDVHLNRTVTAVEEGGVRLEDGSNLAGEEVVLATGLRAKSVVRRLGLPVNQEGSLQVDPHLRSIDDPRVFGAGDCIDLVGHNLPKVGVFGVRAAPVLKHNLLATVQHRELERYRPQKEYLTILNLGDGEALAMRGRLHWRGKAAMRLKDYIDRKFLAQYRK